MYGFTSVITLEHWKSKKDNGNRWKTDTLWEMTAAEQQISCSGIGQSP